MTARFVVLLDQEPGTATLSSELRGHGFRVICVSRSPRSAADTDIHVPASEQIDELASAIRASVAAGELVGVYTFAENSKFRQLRLNAALGLEGDEPETVKGARDKATMRRVLRESGLATHDWHFLPDSAAVEKSPLEFPVVCKPNLGFASGGVRVVHEQAEYERAVLGIRRLNTLLLKPRSPVETGVVVEEFLSGPEYSIDAITWQGETRLFACCGKKYPEGNELIDFAYYSPAASELNDVFQEVVTQSAQSLRYRFGPTHTEVRWDSRRQRWQVLETALRVGFNGHIGSMIRETSGVDYNLLALLSALRQPGAAEYFRTPCEPRGLGVVFSPEVRGRGRFRGIPGLETLRRDPRVRSLSVIPEEGEWVSADGFNYYLILVAVLSGLPDLDRFLADASKWAAAEYL